MLGRRGFFFARVAGAKMQCIPPFLAITHKATVYDPTITKTRERHASVGIEITNSLPCRSSSDRRQLFKPVAPRDQFGGTRQDRIRLSPDSTAEPRLSSMSEKTSEVII